MSDARPGCGGYTVADYFDLVRRGVLAEDDRVELLDGVIVAEPPMDPPHATGIGRATRALGRAVGDRAAIRAQLPFIASPFSVPEPDVAVVHGVLDDYTDEHPSIALLVVEVSASSLQQDRLSKSRIYAGAGVPAFWIVNLRDECVEVYGAPDVAQRIYTERSVARRGDILSVVGLDATVAADELLPAQRTS
jgi:Uma2 family endonuclease